MKLQHTPIIEKKGTQPIEPKPLLFSFLLQNKTNTTKWRSSHGKKNKGSLKANFLSYHHYLMKALDSNINKEKEERKTQKITQKKKRNNKRNSPHSKWSLHNNLPRKFRNVVPEMPTQNMATQPQSIEPLISPHRSHS
jgi:hypothetical protein